MQGIGYTPSREEAVKLLTQMHDVAKDAKGENLYAKSKDGGATIKLFTRSAAGDWLMKVFSPGKRTQQKHDAAEAIKAALYARFPNDVAHRGVGLFGLNSERGIKLAQVEKNYADTRQIETDQMTRSVTDFAASNKIPFRQWHIAANPGLLHFTSLSGEDLTKIMSVNEQISPLALMAFQAFVEHSIKPAHEKLLDASIDNKGVLSFLSGWCGLNSTEKQSLLSKLSPEGKGALEAVDVLARKMIAVGQLPLSASDGFGLHRNLARLPDFGVIKGIVKADLTRSGNAKGEEAGPSRMGEAAQLLGEMIADAWEKQQGSFDYMSRQSELQNVLRAFADRHLSPKELGVPPDQKALADARWHAQRESFVKETCTAALVSHYAGSVALSDNSVFIGVKSYPLQGEKLGEGAEGEVRKLTDASGQSIAVKSISPNGASSTRDQLLREAGMHHIASKTGNKNLVQMFGNARDAQGKLSLFMEFAPHGSIDDYRKSIDQKARMDIGAKDAAKAAKIRQVDRYVFKSILQGLDAMHTAGIIHRDLKPENIFIGNGGTPKIGDFGKAVMVTESISRNKPVDTPYWLAPELSVLDGQQYVDASPASDVWSTAIMMFQLASGGDFPFDFSSGFDADNFGKIKAFAADPFMHDFDMRFRALKLDQLEDKELAGQLCRMLHPDASMRPTARQVLDWLNRQGQSDDPALGKLLVDMSKSR